MSEEKTSTNKKYQMDMCSGSILKKMLMFAVPLMFSSILQLLFNAADIVVVGQFAGDNALAAVGSTSSLINLLVNLFVGLSIGANVLVAKSLGMKDSERANKAAGNAVFLAFVIFVILLILQISVIFSMIVR